MNNKRIAYVGLSSPLFYDYSFHKNFKTLNSKYNPNPIIEGAIGLLILYDEIWFMCESLCPYNMRKLPYVKFLDKEQMLPDLEDIKQKCDEKMKTINNIKNFNISNDNFRKIFDNFQNKIISNWNARLDNHTHSLMISGSDFYANSASAKNIIFDAELSKNLNKKVDLVTNSLNFSNISNSSSFLSNTKLVEELVIKNIPGYLEKNGPYHECFEKLRESKFLQDFRKYVANNVSVELNDICDAKRKIQEEIDKEMKNTYLNLLSDKNMYLTCAKTIASFIPSLGTINNCVDLAQSIISLKNVNKNRWQGFILEVENLSH
ncbi:hypothetical protein IJ670_04395 [bacterium]|nr:hypothetical protein [bacterium]